jgi:hypothetical protein
MDNMLIVGCAKDPKHVSFGINHHNHCRKAIAGVDVPEGKINKQKFTRTERKYVLAFLNMGKFTQTANGAVILVMRGWDAWKTNQSLLAKHAIDDTIVNLTKTLMKKSSSEMGRFGIGFGPVVCM